MNTKNKKNNIQKVKQIFTKREIEYLAFLAHGYHNSQIALKLSVTLSTVKKTIEVIFRKLNAKDRANAVAIGFILGILNADIMSKIAEKYNFNAM